MATENPSQYRSHDLPVHEGSQSALLRSSDDIAQERTQGVDESSDAEENITAQREKERLVSATFVYEP